MKVRLLFLQQSNTRHQMPNEPCPSLQCHPQQDAAGWLCPFDLMGYVEVVVSVLRVKVIPSGITLSGEGRII